MHFPSPKTRSIIIVIKNEIAVTKQKSALAQKDVLGIGNGILFEHDSRFGRHPTTTTYERGGRF